MLPLTGCTWLVLVDGLDELTDPEARRTVIAKLTAATRGLKPCPYGFIVATRDLPRHELPCGDGWAESFYVLQPFAADQLRGLAEGWFREFGLASPDLAAGEFIAELSRAGLADLAQVPLMATMLCHLFALNPGHKLPAGRNAAYRDFVDLLGRHLYTDASGGINAQIHATLDRYGPVATQAGGVLMARSPELIEQLAAARINGDRTPAADLLYSWTASLRPPNIPSPDWQSVLAELLRRSGLLVERGSDLVFLHQTIAEYLAARYVAADEERTARAWRTLLGPRRVMLQYDWDCTAEDWSYRRFLVAAWEGDPRLPAALLRLARFIPLIGCAFIAVLAGAAREEADRTGLIPCADLGPGIPLQAYY